MTTPELRRHVERHKSKDAEKAAAAIAILFGISMALILIGTKLGFRSNTNNGTAIASQTRPPHVAPND
jgi:hypothetical protein